MNTDFKPFYPKNIPSFNRNSFNILDPDVLIDKNGRFYLPNVYNRENRTWSYYFKLNTKVQTEAPEIGDTILMFSRFETDTVLAAGIVENCFLKKPGDKIPLELKDFKISTVVGVLTLRKHPKFYKQIENWH